MNTSGKPTLYFESIQFGEDATCPLCHHPDKGWIMGAKVTTGPATIICEGCGTVEVEILPGHDPAEGQVTQETN